MWLLPAGDVAPDGGRSRMRGGAAPGSGIPGDSPDPANQHHGTEQAPVLAEPRREAVTFDATAVAVMQAGHQDRRVDEVRLLVFHDIDQVHSEKPKSVSRARSRSREQNTGSPSKRGKQAHTTSLRGLTSAPIVPFRTRASRATSWERLFGAPRQPRANRGRRRAAAVGHGFAPARPSPNGRAAG